MNTDNLLQLLPHRYPFLFLDKVVELEAGKRIVCIKNVSINEWFFPGHYPGHPVMPGMLIVEAMAQAGGVLILSTFAEQTTAIAYFSGIDGVRFRKPVRPGDQLRIEVELTQSRGAVYKFGARAFVDGDLVTEAQLVVAVQKEKVRLPSAPGE